MLIVSTEDPRIIRFPKPARIAIDYSKLKVGDVWCTAANHPLSVGIKMKTWGMGKAFSLRHCNHVAVTVKIQEQFFLVEALQQGAVISTCFRYLNPSMGNWFNQVCWICRHVNMTDKDREWLNDQLILFAFDNPEYDSGGAGATRIPFLRQSPNKLFCSELVDTAFTARSADLRILPGASAARVPMDYQISKRMFFVPAVTGLLAA